MCLNLFKFRASACFAYDKTVINQHRVEKSAFEDQSEENLVWIIKWTTLLGIFCKISFTAYCYILLSGISRCTPISGAAMYLRCNFIQRFVVELNGRAFRQLLFRKLGKRFLQNSISFYLWGFVEFCWICPWYSRSCTLSLVHPNIDCQWLK